MTGTRLDPPVLRARAREWLGPAWPLKVWALGFPIWWALGLASIVTLAATAAMAVQITRRGLVRVPAGFGLWLLFLAWMLCGVFVLWADAPGTVTGGGPERLVGFGYRTLWYGAITIAMLYPLTLPSRVLPAVQVARWLAVLFVYCVAGGLAAMVYPSFEFTSLAEVIIPGAQTEGFLRTLVHPSLTTYSDFLGYEQPRPKAPFAYANAWGNNTGLLLPFFVYAWSQHEKRVLRLATPLVLAVAAVPIAYSLNRGLWLGLGVMAVVAALALARAGRLLALWSLTAGLLVAGVILISSPVWETVQLRLDTPHSNERRAAVAEVVTSTTWEGSPLLGYGTTRKMEGNFSSLGGGQTPDCRQCAAPPLGTQGFMWRLVFTTGFVGTALFLGFLAVQYAAHWRRTEGPCVLGILTMTTSLLFFFVYDSLESPLFVLMLAIGLMNRQRLEAEETERARQVVAPGTRPEPAPAGSHP